MLWRKKTPEEFYEYLRYQKEFRPVTIGGYKNVLPRVLRHLGTLTPKPKEAREYLMEMRKKGYSVSHINNSTSIIENYLLFLGRKFKKFERLKRPKPKIKDTLTEGEVARIIAAGKDSREKVMMGILAYTGIRNREFCNLRVKDVDLEKGVVRVFDGKGGKDGVSYLPREGAQLVSKYLSEYPRDENEYLVTTLVRGNQYTGWDLRKRVKVVAKRAGIDKRVFPHLFRHSLATNLIKNGANLMSVQHQLRHESQTTTLVYIRAFPQRIQDTLQFYAPHYV